MAIEVVVLPVANKPNESVVVDDDDDCVILDVKVNKPNRVVDDDDCVVLNGDPENQVNSLNDSPTGFDELLVVGEKGQNACRDYPHSRHLCVKFPYSSTPHERYCGQCHCYVCDSPAPCMKWGNGLSTTDHCHATDKSETWETLREDSKLVKTAPLSASTKNGPKGNVVNSQHNHTLPLDTGSSSISVLMNRSSRSTALRALSARLSRSTASLLRSLNFSLQSQQILGNELSSLSSSLPNQVSRSTKTYPLRGDLLPISMNARSSRSTALRALSARRSRSTKTYPLRGDLLPISMDARSSRSTASRPRSFNFSLQSQANQQILGNELSSLSSSLPNQVSRSTGSYPLTGDLLPISMNAMNALSSRRSIIQNQISMQNNALGGFTASTILNGANNTLASNGYPFNTVPSTSLGVQNPAIKKKRRRRVSGLGTQYTMFNGSDSFGAWNTATTNYVKPPDAPGFSNLFNPQYGGRYPAAAAATGFSNGRNGYGQDGA